jgi:hypothetical protein
VSTENGNNTKILGKIQDVMKEKLYSEGNAIAAKRKNTRSPSPLSCQGLQWLQYSEGRNL